MFLSLSWIFSYHFHFKLTTSRNVCKLFDSGSPKNEKFISRVRLRGLKVVNFCIRFCWLKWANRVWKCSFSRALSALIVFVWIGSSRVKLLNFSSKFYNFAHFSEFRNFAHFSCKIRFCSENFSGCPKFDQTSIVE